MPAPFNAAVPVTHLSPVRWLAAFTVFALASGPLDAQVPPMWTQVASTGPAPRTAHAVAYDSQRGRTVLFGGYGSGSVTLGDTWEWNGTTWTPQLFATALPPRANHAMAYDSQRGRTVLFGGYASVDLGDTWEWDGLTWSQVATTGPSARSDHAMVHDSQRGRTVLFGGSISGSSSNLGDTWEWNGFTWSQVATTGPAVRAHHAMAYDSQRGRTVLFGGNNFANNTNTTLADTWEWDGLTWSQVATTGPLARYLHAMAYDSHRARTVLFGGFAGGGYNDETWEWDGITWQWVNATSPSGRADHAIAYDSQRRRTVLFGGYGYASVNLGDTWEWNAYYISTVAPFGSGCGIAIYPVANARPTINTTAQASLVGITSSLAFVAVGWSRTSFGPFPLPLSLAGYGMPGCELLQSSEAAAEPVWFTSPSTATFSLALPNWSGLIGLHLYLQGWAYAPGANAGHTVVSNGLEWAIGNS